METYLEDSHHLNLFRLIHLMFEKVLPDGFT